METRTPLQLLQFALNRERGHENQSAVNTQLNRHPLLLPNQISFIQRSQTPSPSTHTQSEPLQQRETNPPNPCRQLNPEHQQVCPAKNPMQPMQKKSDTIVKNAARK